MDPPQFAPTSRACAILQSMKQQAFRLVYVLLPVLLLWQAWQSLPRSVAPGDWAGWLTSGGAVSSGLNPYAVYPTTPGDGDMAFPNLNPPIVLPVFEVLTQFPPLVTFCLWYLFGLLCFYVSLRLLSQTYPGPRYRWLWAFSLGGLWITLTLGQIYLPLVLLTCIAWLLLKSGHSLPAGLLIGIVVAVKPNFIIWPGLLFVAGYWSVALPAFVVAGGLSLIPLLRYGPAVYTQWADALRTYSYPGISSNASLHGLAARLDVPALGYIAGGLLLVALALWCWRRCPPVLRVSEWAIVGLLLALPISWQGYTLFLLPLFFACPWCRWTWTAAGLLLLPHAITSTLAGSASTWEYIVFGSLYLLGLLALAINLLCSPSPESPSVTAAPSPASAGYSP